MKIVRSLGRGIQINFLANGLASLDKNPPFIAVRDFVPLHLRRPTTAGVCEPTVCLVGARYDSNSLCVVIVVLPPMHLETAVSFPAGRGPFLRLHYQCV